MKHVTKFGHDLGTTYEEEFLSLP